MIENQNPSKAGNQEEVSLPPDKWFYFAHGRKAANIEELRIALENMEDAEFRHHVDNEKNDFANWAEGVFGEKELAKNLREVADKEGSLILIEEFLKKKHHKEVHHTTAPHEKTEKLIEKEAAEEAEEVIIPEHKKLVAHKKIIPPSPSEEEDSSDQEQAPSSHEKTLSEKELKTIVKDAREVLKSEEERLMGWIKHKPDLHHRFVVKEFIYGFILGLIFGLIMLGIIVNLRA